MHTPEVHDEEDQDDDGWINVASRSIGAAITLVGIGVGIDHGVAAGLYFIGICCFVVGMGVIVRKLWWEG